MEQTLHTPNLDTGRILGGYRELPWQSQRQWIFVILSGIVSAALVAGLYLNVTARAAITGRQIQTLEKQIVINQRVNADLQTQIALQLSSTTLEERAEKMGFEPLKREELKYMVVPGYFPHETVNLTASETQPNILAADPAFKQSLLDWIQQEIKAAAVPLPVFQP